MTTEIDNRKPAPAVLRSSKIPAHERGGGVRTTSLVTRKLGATAFINGITEFDPGAGLGLHSHNCEESVVILEGRAVVEIEGLEYELHPQELTYLPANVPHRFRNASNTEPMRIFWTYGSVDATRRLIATGEVRRIDYDHDRRPGWYSS